MDKRKLSLDVTKPVDYDPPASEVAACRSLSELAEVFGSDKGPLKHNYTKHYEEVLGALRSSEELSLCEIGVACGASLKMWSNWLPKAKIVGIDIREECAFLCSGYENIKILIMNPVEAAIPGIFDVIIDDGSHVSRDILEAFKKNFSRVRPGGFYIIEDCFCTYSENYRKGFSFPKPVGEFDRRYFLALVDGVMKEADKRSGSLISSITYFKELLIVRRAG